MSWIKFSRKFKTIVGNDVITISNGSIFFTSEDGETHSIFSKDLYNSIIDAAEIKSFNGDILLKKDTVEIRIDEVNGSARVPFRYNNERINHFFVTSGQTFFDSIQVSKASIEYLISYFENNEPNNAVMAKYMLDRIFDPDSEEENPSVREPINIVGRVLSYILSIPRCVVVSRKKNGRSLQINTILENCESLLMYIAMNYGCAIKLGIDKSFLKRRGFLPRMTYTMPIIKCKDVFVEEKYIQATATNSYDTKFLFFYQILERIAQKMAPSLFIAEIRDVVSTRSRVSDYDKFVDMKNRINGDNEQQLLEKFLRSKVLLSTLMPIIPPSLITYFENTLPRFIDQKIEAKINFSNQADYSRTMSKRIYWIRNAIVHAKEENFKKKAKETPFDWAVDGELLIPELAMLKLIVDFSIKVYSSRK